MMSILNSFLIGFAVMCGMLTAQTLIKWATARAFKKKLEKQFTQKAN